MTSPLEIVQGMSRMQFPPGPARAAAEGAADGLVKHLGDAGISITADVIAAMTITLEVDRQARQAQAEKQREQMKVALGQVGEAMAALTVDPHEGKTEGSYPVLIAGLAVLSRRLLAGEIQ